MRKRHGGFGSTPDFVFPAFILLLGAVGVFPAYMKWYDGDWPWFTMIGAFFVLPCAFFAFIALSFWLEEWSWKRRNKREERRKKDGD